MTEVNGLGEAVTGAMIARAVEPQAGEAIDDGHFHERDCLNCGTPLQGAYCLACGQKAHLHRSLSSLVHDFVAGLFNFEGKIWRTLPMLAWRPGEMTRRYIAGERARYVSPVAIYLFSVFLMFAVLNFNGTIDPGASNGDVKSQFAGAAEEERGRLAELEADRKERVAEGRDTATIDRRIAATRESVAKIEQLQRGEFIDADLDDDTPSWVRPIVENAQRDPEKFIFNIQDAASKFSWLLIPLSVPFMWMLFPFSRRFRLYDHTVFVTYSLSFMMMLVIVGGLFIAAGMPGFAGFLFFLPPIHMYRQLKGAYSLGRFGALFRTVLLTVFAFIAAALFFASMVAVGVL